MNVTYRVAVTLLAYWPVVVGGENRLIHNLHLTMLCQDACYPWNNYRRCDCFLREQQHQFVQQLHRFNPEGVRRNLHLRYRIGEGQKRRRVQVGVVLVPGDVGQVAHARFKICRGIRVQVVCEED